MTTLWTEQDTEDFDKLTAENAKLKAELAEAVTLFHFAVDNADEIGKMKLAYHIAQRHPVSESVRNLADSYLRIVEFFEKHEEPTTPAAVDIWTAIRTERAYQDRKYGCPQARALTVTQYLKIARGELNEARSAAAEGDTQNALLELLQVVAVGVACLELHGVVERKDVTE